MKNNLPKCTKSLPFVFTALILIAFSFNSQAQTNDNTPPGNNQPELMKAPDIPPLWSYNLIQTGANQWGFDICKDRIVIMNNKVIPGLESITFYSRESIAIDLADFILRKIENEGYPLKPISQEELINAGIVIN